MIPINPDADKDAKIQSIEIPVSVPLAKQKSYVKKLIGNIKSVMTKTVKSNIYTLHSKSHFSKLFKTSPDTKAGIVIHYGNMLTQYKK